ncbi:MAG: hypothetical protein EKK37_05760 [Sphingobacteriales bacterium]|nr:MAG: hypothetical protein EKK37_05760 [Sphingobacteriales bacterium]
MRKLLLLAGLLFSIVSPASPTQIALTGGMHISASATIRKGTYKLNAPADFKTGVIIIEGNNITIDFNGSTLVGSNDKQLPNEFYGVGIFIKSGKNITIKNAVAKGYKVAVLALQVENLTIENCDFSYNYRQHLNSNREREDVSDWMSYHHNENNEWLRYGAGIYLDHCNMATIRYNQITNGQCGLMMTNCNDGRIYNNNFSFNSAIGIGLYRSSRNNILSNQLDFNVRGYSHGIYWRGQDSAGILVFEQCNENQFINNSVTHGGDGFFLWAGQHTMDSGEGGCNDNIIYKNDFSYAPTNGIEVTFSRNYIERNIVKECDHGIWGGYSYNTFILYNEFEKNRIGIAIEHGQENSIYANKFNENKEAIKLWARKTQPADWGYAQKRDTRSRNYKITGNDFKQQQIVFDLALTDSININENTFKNNTDLFKTDSNVTHLDSITTSDIQIIPSKSFLHNLSQSDKIKKHWFNNFPKGKKEIRITQWGPYNFQYPIIWLSKVDSNNKMEFEILGPKGNWKIKNSKGVKDISSASGKFPATLTAIKNGEEQTSIELEYTGPSFSTQLGKKIKANQPYTFSYTEFTPQLNWNVNWYKWDEKHNPNKDYQAFQQVLNGSPVLTKTTNKLEYTWWGEIGKALPADSFATVATTSVILPKGKYEIGATADDLVKVFIDGKLVIDFWDATKYVYDEDAHHSAIVELEGKHDIRVEHVENSGYATILFTIKLLPY